MFLVETYFVYLPSGSYDDPRESNGIRWMEYSHLLYRIERYTSCLHSEYKVRIISEHFCESGIENRCLQEGEIDGEIGSDTGLSDRSHLPWKYNGVI